MTFVTLYQMPVWDYYKTIVIWTESACENVLELGAVGMISITSILAYYKQVESN